VNGDDAAILVVDDVEDNRYTLIRRLKLLGHRNVGTAENGRQALDVLAAERVELVLLDIMMPEMNGYEVLERMKGDPALRNIPVIMISAVDEIDSVVRCIELGADDYLTKPFNPVLLKARIGACLDRNRLRRQELAYLERIKAESQRADALLHAMLPAEAVQELKATDRVNPRRLQDVVVLFSDLVGFTAYCDAHSPEELVGNLQIWVDACEAIVDELGLEKIKTIGDAFMVAAGVHRRVETPALAAVRCGLRMAAAARELGIGWQVRVGINRGPVVAGVIGRRQYMFDLWGDTVNVGAHVVRFAAPGSVVATAPVWMDLRHRCRGRSLGLVELKGKGHLELIECHAVD
jgi:CheY-like chemotaxis protein